MSAYQRIPDKYVPDSGTRLMGMKRIVFLSLVAVLFASTSSVALTPTEAADCRSLAATFAPRKAALDEKIKTRDTLAAEAEALGEAWENAAALRAFSREAAAEADTAKAEFDAAKARFEQAETDVQSTGASLNADFRRFNATCVKD